MRIWIGGTDEGSEGDWQWTSGQTWDGSVATWALPVEPDNWGDLEHSLQLNLANSLWYDGYGVRSLNFVCQWVA